MKTTTGTGNTVRHTESFSTRASNAEQGMMDTNKKLRFPNKWEETQGTAPETQEGLII